VDCFRPADDLVQGWTRTYETVTMNNITRTKRNAEIVTGKILVTCKVTIDGLGTHSGTSEEWADDGSRFNRRKQRTGGAAQ